MTTVADTDTSQIRAQLAQNRVRQGAAFLDVYFPGWRDYLRQYWDLVCMTEAQHCVLATAGHMHGRLVSSGDVTRRFRSIIDLGNPAMGFYEDSAQGGVSYDELTLAWKELLFNQPDPPPRASEPPPSLASFWRKISHIFKKPQRIAA